MGSGEIFKESFAFFWVGFVNEKNTSGIVSDIGQSDIVILPERRKKKYTNEKKLQEMTIYAMKTY